MTMLCYRISGWVPDRRSPPRIRKIEAFTLFPLLLAPIAYSCYDVHSSSTKSERLRGITTSAVATMYSIRQVRRISLATPDTELASSGPILPAFNSFSVSQSSYFRFEAVALHLFLPSAFLFFVSISTPLLIVFLA